jgi:hypothetical protein
MLNVIMIVPHFIFCNAEGHYGGVPRCLISINLATVSDVSRLEQLKAPDRERSSKLPKEEIRTSLFNRNRSWTRFN